MPAEKIEYSEQRRTREKALSYSTKYDRKLHKRISQWRERRLLDAILRRTGRSERILDVPSGPGRLSGIIASHGEKVFESDYSVEMLKLCRIRAREYEPILAAATAFQLPFRPRAFDLVVSIRLSHHIPDRSGRLEHLREMMRVARRFVLATFFGEETLKNRLHELGNRFRRVKKNPKLTLRRTEVRDLAREEGFRTVCCKSLSSLFSGHHFVLLERTER